MKKKEKKDYTMTPEELTASEWCVMNDICITARQAGYGVQRWYIDIERGKWPKRELIGTTPESYPFPEYQKKLAEYRLYYYKKYANKIQDSK